MQSWRGRRAGTYRRRSRISIPERRVQACRRLLTKTYARANSSTRQDDRVVAGRPDVGLHQPPVVHDAERRRHVGEAVQPPPRPAAQPADHAGGRGQRQRHQQHERGEAGGDERPLRDVLHDGRPVEELVEPDVRQQVQRAVEERKEAEHPPDADDVVPAGQPAKRRDRQRDQQEPQRPQPCRSRDRLDRIRAKPSLPGPTQQVRQRPERGDEDQRLDQPGGTHGRQ